VDYIKVFGQEFYEGEKKHTNGESERDIYGDILALSP
jgi:hypothetical protein